MTEIKEDLNILKYVTQYDVKQSTALMETIRLLMTDDKSAKAAINFINKQVSSSVSKELAFNMLIKILPDCEQSILDENAKTWTSYAVSKHQDEVIAGCRFQFLVALYHRCHSNQEFYKTIVTNLLPKIIDTCLWVHVKSAETQHALNCLYFTMKYFSSACIVYKQRIEEYVIKFLDLSSKIATILEAAKCFHMLNQIGGAGTNGSIHIKNFEVNFVKLYNSLNLLYDKMFENVNEFCEVVIPDDVTNVITFKEIPPYLGTNDVYHILSRRMENIVIFLMQMLQTDYNMKKTITPAILNVIQRGLDIHVHRNENDVNGMLFSQIVQQHQIKLLFLLKALIQSLQHSFMRHSTIKMLFRYLARVTDCNCYNFNSFYKSTIYNIIKFWLQCSGEQIDAKTYEKLIEIIINDISPNTETLVLQINVNSGKGKGKTKITSEKVENTNTVTPRELETRVQNCQAALELLETLFKSVHLNITKATCTQLFHIITSTLLDICVKHFCPPYTTKSCRLQLFKVLIATFDQHMHTIDIDLAVNILSLAQNGDDVELSLTCQQGLKIIEKIAHPIQSSIAPIREVVDRHDADMPSEKSAENGTVTVLSNYLIQSNEDEHEETLRMEANGENTEKTDGDVDGTEKNALPHSVVEISDNECEIQPSNTLEEVSIVESTSLREEPLPKKRRADDQEVIYTFDISQGEEAVDAFVDEVN